MRTVWVLIMTLVTIQISFGQADSIKQSDLDSLYVRTIRNQIWMTLSSGYKYFEITENTKKIRDKVGVPIFKFLTQQELIDNSLKNKKSIIAYRVLHKIISPDTVDINIGVVYVTAKSSIHFNRGLRTRKANFAISSGGTNGYIPTERFAYNKTTKTWDRIEFEKPKNFRDNLNNN